LERDVAPIRRQRREPRLTRGLTTAGRDTDAGRRLGARASAHDSTGDEEADRAGDACATDPARDTTLGLHDALLTAPPGGGAPSTRPVHDQRAIAVPRLPRARSRGGSQAGGKAAEVPHDETPRGNISLRAGNSRICATRLTRRRGRV